MVERDSLSLCKINRMNLHQIEELLAIRNRLQYFVLHLGVETRVNPMLKNKDRREVSCPATSYV